MHEERWHLGDLPQDIDVGVFQHGTGVVDACRAQQIKLGGYPARWRRHVPEESA